MAAKLGILAGSGELPLRVIEACRALQRPFFVLALEESCDEMTVAAAPHAWARLGAAATAFRLLRENGVTEIVMAGGVRRPSLWALRPDWRALQFLARIGLRAFRDVGDDALLRAVIAEIESEGFHVVGVEDVLRELVAPSGVLGRHHPDAAAEADIAAGLAAARAHGARDLGQAVIVRHGEVLGVEDEHGTDALIRRNGAAGGVLVKTAKPGQERRADLPTIGPKTIAAAALAGLSGIAIEAGAALVLDRDAVVAAADDAGIFVVGGRVAAEETEDEAPLVYIVAGEPSGDLLGGRLMAALRQRLDGKVRFAGIGGEAMAAQGLLSRVPLAELAIMGVAEVLPQARRIFRRVAETVADIRRQKPAALVTIDSSGFNWRIAQRLRGAGETLPLIHYVAPMVWAWRPGRARRVARWYDQLLALLPFEPPYFTAVGLPCSYVGHPVVESGADRGDGAAFRRRHAIPADVPLLIVLPGSRRGEVTKLLPIFAAAVERLVRRYPKLRIAVPTVETVADHVTAEVEHWNVPSIVLRGAAEKYDAFAAGTAALAASGTVALELAMARLPSVIAYRISPLTHAYVRRVVKIAHANLINLILQREAVPELLQQDCTPKKLAAAVEKLLDDPTARAAQIAACQEALRALGYGGVSPALRAADEVLAVIARKSAPS